MQKQRIGSKVTVKGTALRKARRYGRVSICFWSKKNKSFGAPSTRRNRNPYTKPRRFDKSILSDLPWIFKEEFYMVEGKKNLPVKPTSRESSGTLSAPVSQKKSGIAEARE